MFAHLLIQRQEQEEPGLKNTGQRGPSSLVNSNHGKWERLDWGEETHGMSHLVISDYHCEHKSFRTAPHQPGMPWHAAGH